MSDAVRKPRAFKLSDGKIVAEDAPDVVLADEPDAYAREAEAAALPNEEIVVEAAQKRGLMARALFSWAGLFWSAAGGLVSLALGLWFDALIEDLYGRFPALGWLALALLGAALLALFALASRETRAVLRQQRIAKLHAALAQARAADDRGAARRLVGEMAALYAQRAETARARADLAAFRREIVDGRDLIDIAERSLLHPLDERVTREIAAAARRVSVVTAISPRALLDVLFVLAQAARLIRRISEIYGGRPGFLGFVRLVKSVAAHLAITGGMAVGDSLVQQIVGHGIAARLSARLGEGVLNGLLTARVGLSAMAVCRPAPFAAEKAPGVGDVAPFLFSSGEKKD
jgi:putative membrane protein